MDALKALVCLGGNLAVAMSDRKSRQGDAYLDLAVHIATKLNRSHFAAREAILHPSLSWTYRDRYSGERAAVGHRGRFDVDGHASRGGLKPASERLKSEPPSSQGWRCHIAAHPGRLGRIDRRLLARSAIASRRCIRDFADFNARIKKPSGFRLYVAGIDREWLTPTKRANFLIYSRVDEDLASRIGKLSRSRRFRSHDLVQHDDLRHKIDRYRGNSGRRDVRVRQTMATSPAAGLKHGDLVDITVVPEWERRQNERVMRQSAQTLRGSGEACRQNRK